MTKEELEVVEHYERYFADDPRKNIRINNALRDLRCMRLPIDEIIKDYESGMSMKEMEDWYGVSRSTLVNRLKEAGVYQSRPKGRQKKELPMEEVIKDYESGMPMRRLKHKYKVSFRTLRRRLVESGVVLRGQEEGGVEKDLTMNVDNENVDIEVFKKEVVESLNLEDCLHKKIPLSYGG